jgi:hypothetical protein
MAVPVKDNERRFDQGTRDMTRVGSMILSVLFAAFASSADHLFSYSSGNWAGIPLASYETVLKYIRRQRHRPGFA